MISKNLVTGIDIQSKQALDPICEPCLSGKMNANPFPSSKTRASKPLELIHTDLHVLKYNLLINASSWYLRATATVSLQVYVLFLFFSNATIGGD